jgi:prepilin-type N-terminal cleavage/methylation domain-containing protein
MYTLIKNKRGFTMVELTIGTAIFSVLMVGTTITLINIFHIYQKGIAVRATQKNVRIVADTIAKDASGAQQITIAAGPNRLCLQTDRTKPSRMIQYAIVGTALRRAEGNNTPPGTCPSIVNATSPPMTSGEVTIFNFNPTAGPTDHLADYQFTAVANSNLADYNPVLQQCNFAPAGAQFCSATTLNASVDARGETSGG